MALGIMVFFSTVTATAILVTQSTQSTVWNSNAAVDAAAAAEAGVNAAMATLEKGNPADTTLLTTPVTTSFGNGSSVTWSGTFSSSTSKWTITSTGTAPATTGGGSAVTRNAIATVFVHAGTGQTNAAAWNFAMSRGTSNATTCDMTLANSTNMQAPLYVEGNLCLIQSSKISQGVDPVNLTVKGKLAPENGNTIGTSVAPITEADIGGGCTSNITTAAHACSTTDKVYATTLNNTASTLIIPTADYTSAYANANPGPNHPCTTSSGSPPVWDNDSTLDLTGHPNGSEYPSSSPFNLTPASSYTCEAKDGSGNIIGQLDWNVSTKTLTVSGETYIDGSVTVGNSSANHVVGSGSLYLTGAFTITGSAKLCSVMSGNNCDFTNWNPNNALFMIVAHGDDGTGSGFNIVSSGWFEGAVYTTKTCTLGSSAQFEGPIIGNPISLSSSTQMKPLPPINSVPIGAPIPTNTSATVDPPVFTMIG